LQTINQIRETFRSRNVAVLTGTQTLWMFAAFLWWPYRSLFILELGATKETLGMLLMIETLGQVVFQLPGSMLADHVGRKPCIIVSRILSPLSTIGFTFSSSFWQMGVTRALGGVAQGFGGLVWGPVGGPVWQALVADLTTPQSRGRMMGLMGSIAGVVSTPASWMGGYMYDNVSPKLPFQTSFLIDILGTIIFVMFLKEPERARPKVEPVETP